MRAVFRSVVVVVGIATSVVTEPSGISLTASHQSGKCRGCLRFGHRRARSWGSSRHPIVVHVSARPSSTGAPAERARRRQIDPPR